MKGDTAVLQAAEKNHKDVVDLLLLSSGSVMDQEIQYGNFCVFLK